MLCLNERTLSSYLDGAISKVERQRIEAHISKCDRCLDFLLVAYEAQGCSEKIPPYLKKRITKRLGLKQKSVNPGKKWLFSALVLFALSFVFKTYFLQFLIAAGILGLKWVMEGEGAKRVVMIFRGIDKNEKIFEGGERKSPPPLSDIVGGDRYGEGE